MDQAPSGRLLFCGARSTKVQQFCTVHWTTALAVRPWSTVATRFSTAGGGIVMCQSNLGVSVRGNPRAW